LNIDWIIPCRYGEVHANLATLVGAGIDTFLFPEFPAQVQVGLAVRLLATADELGPEVTHTVRSVIRDPDGVVLSDVEEEFSVGTHEEAAVARTEWLNGIALTTMIAFEAAQPGSYSYEHIVDGATKSVPLHVVELPTF
jgi:hypothetical protein